jgi:hypothetical protein
MYMFINALILAFLVPASSADTAENGPACRAHLEGLNLLTIIEFPTGLTVEGPWRVVHTGEQIEDVTQYVMFATLDRIIEKDAISGSRNVIPFPEPVSLAFEGTDQKALIHHAAQVWCVTVMRAQENRKLERLSPHQALNTRVASVAGVAPLS